MPNETQVYLDYSATTPLDPRVLETMLPYFRSDFGNPSSTHSVGQRAETAAEAARDAIAHVLGGKPEEVIFTGGGSESDNLALRGAAIARRNINGGSHILISPVEHMAVSATAKQLEKEYGFELEFLPVDAGGRVDPEDLKRRIRSDTALVSIIHANNEIGTINPVSDLGNVCKVAGVPFHTDALQAALYLELDHNAVAADLISLGAHKFYGPKGTGVLFIREGTPVEPIQTGGDQEFGMRGGTLNVPLITGMAKALQIAREEKDQISPRITTMRDQIITTALETVPDALLTGDPVHRLPHHASFVFKGVDGNLLSNLLDAAGFACSSGSACKTGNPAPSSVLIALGLDPKWAIGSLRVTLGRWTTEEEVHSFCKVLPDIVARARTLGAA